MDEKIREAVTRVIFSQAIKTSSVDSKYSFRVHDSFFSAYVSLTGEERRKKNKPDTKQEGKNAGWKKPARLHQSFIAAGTAICSPKIV